jgi:hypothetical protein
MMLSCECTQLEDDL